MLRNLHHNLGRAFAVSLVLAIGAGAAVARAAAPIAIDAVYVSDDRSRLTIAGRNLLEGGPALKVYLRGIDAPLDVALRTSTQLDALLPESTATGEYLLWLGYGSQPEQYDEFLLWIGPPVRFADAALWHPNGAATGGSIRIPRMTWTDLMSKTVTVSAPLADLVISYDATFAAQFPCSPYVRATVNGMPMVSARVVGVPPGAEPRARLVASGGQTVIAPGVGPGQYTVVVQAYLDWPAYESTCTEVTALDIPTGGVDADTASALTVKVLRP